MHNQRSAMGSDIDWMPELETCVAMPGVLAHAESSRQSVSDTGVLIALLVNALSDG